ncbi:uncharacterized protein LOC123551196 [Mercenaria mercenaria]|uniref:uncharacterized protein LOC123551196 n=1 Tax=Mercenaria mercenaria TaxID=6596 RepID=UPI00234F6EE4|nr:uncharacterized protein LOC123551196 [Mercenaria mercenaria]
MGKRELVFYMGFLYLTLAQRSTQIRTDSRTDRRIHNLETELSKMRILHNSGKERLRELEREITHYQTIFQGLDLLCNTLHQHKSLYKPLPGIEAPMTAIKPTVSGITAYSVTTIFSPLGDHAVVQLSVRYSTSETHEVIWAYNVLGHMVPIQEGDPYSSVRNEKDGEQLTTHLYIDAKDLEGLELLYVKILSEFSEVTILFNKDSLMTDGRMKLSPVRLWNEEPSREVLVLDPKQNATISINIDTNIDKLTTFVNFIGIDTSSQPNRLMDLQLSDRRLTTEILNTTRGFKWSVTLDSSLVYTGGMVSLRIVEQLQNGPVLQIHVGKTMYVIPDTPGLQKAPFPSGSLALLSLYKHTGQTIATKRPIGAIWCYAFGNPAPTTNIIKFEVGGRRKVLKGRVFNIGHYDSAQVIVLGNITNSDEGQYLCEAKSGVNVVSEPIYVSVT